MQASAALRRDPRVRPAASAASQRRRRRPVVALASQRGRELAEGAAALADEYEHVFGVVAALAACAQQRGEAERMALLARNGMGKSTLLNLLIQTLLVSQEEYALPAAGGAGAGAADQAGSSQQGAAAQPSRLEERLHAEGVPYKVCANPDSSLNADHLARARQLVVDFWRGCSDDLADAPLLFPIGRRTSTTTQVQMSISNASKVECLIRPRSRADLAQITEATLSKIEDQVDADDEGDDSLLNEVEFVKRCELLHRLTGRSIVDTYNDSAADGADRSLADIVAELRTADMRRRVDERGRPSGDTLLSRELADIAGRLKPVLFTGTCLDLSSDVGFIAQKLANPMAALLDELSEEERSRLHLPRGEMEDLEMQGMLVERVEVTVPTPALGPLVVVDIPGLDDVHPFANHNIRAAMDEAHHVLAVAERNLGGEQGLIDYLAHRSNWQKRQLDNVEGRGHLIVLNHAEKFSLPLSCLWSGKAQEEAEANKQASHKALKASLATAVPANVPRKDRQKHVDAFLDSRVHILTALPVNYCALQLASAEDVMDNVRRKVKDLPADVDAEVARERLLAATNMQQFLGVLGVLSAPQERRRLEELLAETERVTQALEAAAGEDAVPAERAAELRGQLEYILGRPKQLSQYIQGSRNRQAADRAGSAAGRTLVQDVTAQLEASLLACLAALEAEYTDTRLSDDAIEALVKQEVDALKAARTPSNQQLRMRHLRGICKNRNNRVRTPVAVDPYVPDVVSNLVGSVLVAGSTVWKDGGRKEALKQAHREAAQGLCAVLLGMLDELAPGEGRRELREFLSGPAMWEAQLVARVEQEIGRVAEANLFQTGAFDTVLEDRLRELLKKELERASDAVPAGARKPAFWAPFTSALTEALKSFRTEVPAKLREGVKAHVNTWLFSEAKLFLSIGSKRHSIAKAEMGRRQEAAAAGALLGLGGNDEANGEGAGADAPQGTPQRAQQEQQNGAQQTPAFVPPSTGQAARGKRRSKAAEELEAQACLWRALYRFLSSAEAAVTVQDTQHDEQRSQLLERLQELRAGLAEAVEQPEGAGPSSRPPGRPAPPADANGAGPSKRPRRE